MAQTKTWSILGGKRADSEIVGSVQVVQNTRSGVEWSGYSYIKIIQHVEREIEKNSLPLFFQNSTIIQQKEIALKLAFKEKRIKKAIILRDLLVVCGRNALKKDSGSASVNVCVNPSGPRSQSLFKSNQTIHVPIQTSTCFHIVPPANFSIFFKKSQ